MEEVLLERESKLEGVNLDSFLHSDKSDSFMLLFLLKILCRYVCKQLIIWHLKLLMVY